MRRIFMAIAIAVWFAGCRATVPEGVFVCSDATNCPDGWACVRKFCYSSAAAAPPPMFDASLPDAGPL